MSGSAYLLIQTGSGAAASALETLRGLEEVSVADPITGPYDLVAHITGDPVTDAVDRVRGELSDLQGVGRTLTCLRAS